MSAVPSFFAGFFHSLCSLHPLPCDFFFNVLEAWKASLPSHGSRWPKRARLSGQDLWALVTPPPRPLRSVKMFRVGNLGSTRHIGEKNLCLSRGGRAVWTEWSLIRRFLGSKGLC